MSFDLFLLLLPSLNCDSQSTLAYNAEPCLTRCSSEQGRRSSRCFSSLYARQPSQQRVRRPRWGLSRRSVLQVDSLLLPPTLVADLAFPFAPSFGIADIFLHCTDNYSGDSSFQIWLNKKEKGYVLAKEGRLPKGAGQITFADMGEQTISSPFLLHPQTVFSMLVVRFSDRDGTLDMVFPTCSSFSTRTGIGKDCSINIAYNQQIPLCSATSLGGSASCRDPQALCSSDPAFSFDFTEGGDVSRISSLLSLRLHPSVHRLSSFTDAPIASPFLGVPSQSFTSFPLSTLFPGSQNHNDNNLASSSLLLFDVSHDPSIPIPLRVGDYNLDGYPDLMIILATARGTTTVRLLQSETCSSSNSKECGSGKAAEKGRRRFREVVKGAEALTTMEDVRGASFMDIDEDVSCEGGRGGGRGRSGRTETK